MSLLDVALACIDRGWYVFPCKPKAKEPLVAGGFKVASQSDATIREWWTKWPNANVGIATGESELTVLDIDHGVESWEDVKRFCASRGVPTETYIVRTGRRPGFGVQLYFRGQGVKSTAWTDSDGDVTVSGDIRGATGYVMAAGSIHPSGAAYEALSDGAVNAVPDYIKTLAPTRTDKPADEPITTARNNALTAIAGKLRNAGLSPGALEVALLQVNEERCSPPLGESEVKRIASNVAGYPLPESAIQIRLGKGVSSVSGRLGDPLAGRESVSEAIQEVDWRARYHSQAEMRDAPPASFLIEGFLQLDSITALAAPVGQRKSLISLNVAHALCTGEPLFGKFPVVQRPSRVLYLCPEMGLASFTARLKKIGLLEYVGKTLFCTTMNSAAFRLDELTADELDGAVVIIDTAVRYLEGDENSSEDMRAFAASVFRVKALGGGQGAILLLHHSGKGTKESSELTLENAMRGSGELGAFVTSCWATRLQDPNEPYKSASYLKNVKQRDFESDPFDVTGDEHCRLHYVEQQGVAVLQQNKGGNVANRDGLDDQARALIRENPKLGAIKLVQLLAEHGIKRGRSWCGERKLELLAESGGMMP